jgi:hypothetical protein
MSRLRVTSTLPMLCPFVAAWRRWRSATNIFTQIRSVVRVGSGCSFEVQHHA